MPRACPVVLHVYTQRPIRSSYNETSTGQARGIGRGRATLFVAASMRPPRGQPVVSSKARNPVRSSYHETSTGQARGIGRGRATLFVAASMKTTGQARWYLALILQVDLSLRSRHADAGGSRRRSSRGLRAKG